MKISPPAMTGNHPTVCFRKETLLLLLAAGALAAAELAPPRHPAVGGRFEPADVDWARPVYQNAFDHVAALGDWRLEGGRAMSVRDGRLVLEHPPGAKTPEDNRGHLVCWLTKEVPPDFLLEFTFRPQNRKQGLAIVFFAARGDGGRSVFDPGLKPRDGTFVQYLRGDIDNYHISYWAGDRGTANVRKNRGFHFVGSATTSWRRRRRRRSRRFASTSAAA